MRRGVSWSFIAPLIALGLVGCRYFGFEEREPWRAEAEEQCIAEGAVQRSAYVEMGSALNGKGTCGMTRPFKVAAVNGGFVELKPKATLSCPLVANVEAWFMEGVQPAAMAWYGSPVTEIKQISAYSCRTMNGQPGAAISEHAFGNALDIASFRFADGRQVDFKSGWKGKPEERGFLRAVHAAACERFSTVLAPGSNVFHYDHIHVDLARRASGRQVCNPAPMTLPPPPPRLPETPVARVPAPKPAAERDYVWQTPAGVESRSASSNRAGGEFSDSPFAPRVAAREPGTRSDTQPNTQPAGSPLVLSNPAPPPNEFGKPAPIADRVRQALGTPAPVPQAPPQPPMRQPGYSNPYGLVPPGRIPNARTGTDPTVTGSIAAPERKRDSIERRANRISSSLMDPQSIMDQKPSSEAASVFNLPSVNGK